MFHHHKWVEVKRTFNRPNKDVISVKNVSPEDLQKILHGFTIIELKCDDCGDMKFHETLGSAL